MQTKKAVNFDQTLNPEGLNFWNVISKKPLHLLKLFFSAAFYVMANTLFFAKANIISSGIVGFVQFIIYTNEEVLLPYFSWIVFAFNIPILLLFWRFLPTRFLIFTTYWLIFQILVQTFFEFSRLSGVFSRLSLFDVAEGVSWNVNNPQHNQTWPIFIYGLIGGATSISAAAFAWKSGGSSGGMDILVAYFVFKKKISVGKINMVVAFACSIFSVSLNMVFSILSNSFYYTKFISRVSTTILIILMSNWLFNLIYPKYKKVLLRIYSVNSINQIIKKLQEIDYWHAYNVVRYSTRFRDSDWYLETSCLYLESKTIIGIIRSVDPNVFISVQPVLEIFGRFNTQKID